MAAENKQALPSLDVWTSALLNKSTTGRGSNGKVEAYGIKKLRELILELAISGRLLGKDTSGWSKTLLGEIGEWGSGGTPLKAHPEYYGGDIPWLVIGDLNDGLVTEAQTYINQLGLENSSAQLVPEGTLLIAMYGSIGKLGIAGIPCATNQAIAFCRPDSSQIETQYLFLYLRAIREHLLSRGQGLAQQNISQKILKATSIKLPALDEQRRIVAKVDELMALCDQLEQQQTDNLAAHQTLVETLLGTLTCVESQQEFSAAWARIASHFDTLFNTEASIDHLKQTILQLAVMGKLVPQDPSDEPAKVLAERIVKAKEKLAEDGVIRKRDTLPEIDDAERPFALPAGWSFVRLSYLTKVITKGSSPKWQGVSYTDNPDDVLFVTSENVGSYELLLDSKKYVEKRFNEVEPRSILKKGDFLMNIVGASIGRTAIYDLDTVANINQAVCLIRVFPEFLDSKFLLHFFNSAICVSYMFDKQVDNARANLSMGNIAKFVMPLPPLAEQHRIVAKVDEIMALCDTLKARLADAQTTQLHLADAIVEQAVC